MKYIFLVILSLVIINPLLSQDTESNDETGKQDIKFNDETEEEKNWKDKTKLEFIIGTANCLTDLGGTDEQAGEGLAGFRDLEMKTTRHVIGFGVEHRLGWHLYQKLALYHAKVSGSDALTNNPKRRWRNLSFRSPIVELSYQIRFTINNDQGGHRYKLKGVRGRKSLQVNTYFVFGIGAFWFNPKAKYNGNWVALQPLGTEGQGQSAIEFNGKTITPSSKYSRISMVLPMAIGMTRQVNRDMSVALEMSYRKTFTDYLDDVSTVYYDQFAFSDPVAADLSIRSDELDSSLDPEYSSTYSGGYPSILNEPGQGRGDPDDKDGYLFFSITFKKRLR